MDKKKEYSYWSDQELNYLILAYNNDESVRNIQNTLKRSPNSIYQKINYLKNVGYLIKRKRGPVKGSGGRPQKFLTNRIDCPICGKKVVSIGKQWLCKKCNKTFIKKNK